MADDVLIRGRTYRFSFILGNPCDAFLPEEDAALVLIQYEVGKRTPVTTLNNINHMLLKNVPLSGLTIVFGKRNISGKHWGTVEVHCKKLQQAEKIFRQLGTDFGFDTESDLDNR